MSQKSVCCNNKYLLPHTTHSTCCHMEQLRDFKHIVLAQQGSLNIQLLRSLFPLNPVFTAPQNRTDTTRIPPYLLLIAAAKAKEERTLASAESVVRTLCLLQPCNVLYSHAIRGDLECQSSALEFACSSPPLQCSLKSRRVNQFCGIRTLRLLLCTL